MFISFDGIDGAGKSTQIQLLVDYLRAAGHAVTACRDPGTTALGDQVRQLVLHGSAGPLGRRAEMLLYMAARAQLVEEVVRPALERGEVVVSDRFLLSNVVYQGYGGGLEIDALWQIGGTACGGLEPDVYVVLDMPAEAAFARLDRPLDRMEARGLDFFRRLRDGFLTEAARRPDRIAVVGADAPIEAVAARIREQVAARM